MSVMRYRFAAMVCLVCSMPGRLLCKRCRRTLEPVPDILLSDGTYVRAGYRHTAAARVLVRRLKYEGIEAAAGVLAERMAAVEPAARGIVVPIPRVALRRQRYGIDPARVLARRFAAETGGVAADLLVAPLWAPRHAGRRRGRRSAIAYRRREAVPGSVVLVDDVLTTGRTLMSARAALADARVVGLTATAAGRVRV